MARRIRDKGGKITRIEFDAAEMAELLEVDPENLDGWRKAIPPLRVEDGEPVYAVASKRDLKTLQKRAAILRTQMSERAVQNIEKQGLLDAYAALSEDCPAGITAHIWRSYGVIVLMQTRYGKMLDAEELAKRAGLTEIDEKSGKRVLGAHTAETHIRILKGLGIIKEGEGPEWHGQWQHRGLPKSWRGL